MNKQLLLFCCVTFLILATLAGCGGGPDRVVDDSGGVLTFTIHERSIDGSIDLTEIVDSVTYIPLETTPESLIGYVIRAYFVDDMVLVQSGQQIFFFDKRGKFLRKISRRGRGPGEYLNLSNTILDETNKRIIVYDGYGDKLLYYDFEGVFRKEVPDFAVKYFPREIALLPNGNFLCYRPDHGRGYPHPSGLWEVDSMGVFKRWVRQDDTVHPDIMSFQASYLYPMRDGKTGFNGVETTSGYYYDGSEMVEYCSFVFDSKTADHYEGMYNDEFIELSMKGETFLVRDYFYDNGKYILSSWVDDGNKLFYALYDRSDGSLKTTRTPVDSDFPRIVVNRRGDWVAWEFVFSNDPDVIVAVVRHDLFFDRGDEYANPVLQVLQVKRPGA